MQTSEVVSLLGLVLNAIVLPLAWLVFHYVRDTDAKIAKMSERMTKLETRFSDHDKWEREGKHNKGDDTE